MKTKNPKKGIGGSVWKTYDDAKKYASNNFRVYGVIARWNIDTELDPEGDGWHILKIASPLKNLNYD